MKRMPRLALVLLAALLPLPTGCSGSEERSADTTAPLDQVALDVPYEELAADLVAGDSLDQTSAHGDVQAADEVGQSDQGTDQTELIVPDQVDDQSEVATEVDPVEAFLDTLNSGDSAAMETLLQAYSGPVCHGSRCLILSSVPYEGDVAIRGCFNGWGEQDLMTPVPGKVSYFYYILEPVGFENYCEYRLYYNAEWHDDLSNPYIRFSDVSINNAIYLDGHSRLARVRSVYSSALNNYRDIYVYIPAAAFPDTGRKFPVMYMQDGFNVFRNPMAPYGSWDVDVSLDAMIGLGEVAPLVVVGIDTSDRLNEYLYCEMEIDLGDEVFTVEPKLDKYLAFVVEDLKPLVDARFPTLPGRETTGIGGSSLGGISSMYMAWKRPDVFGKVASFSGSYGIGEENGEGSGGVSFLDVLGQSAPGAGHAGLRVYLDSGDQGDEAVPYASDSRVHTDWVRNALIRYGWSSRPEWTENGDAFGVPVDYPTTTDPALVPTLFWSEGLPAGYATWAEYLRPEQDLLHLVGAGHSHNEAAWKARFPNAMRFLWWGVGE